MFDSYSWYKLIQLIVDIPLGSKVRYPDLSCSPLQSTLAVPPSWYGLRFTSLPPGGYTGSLFQTNLAVTFSGFSPILHRRRGCSWQFCKAKGDNKVEYNLLDLGGMGIFVVSTLLILHAIGNFGVFETPTSWELMKIWKKVPFWLLTLPPLRNGASQISLKLCPPE